MCRKSCSYESKRELGDESMWFKCESGSCRAVVAQTLITSSQRSKQPTAMSLEARLQAASSDYQKLQADISNVVEARQRLDAQLSENELVKKGCRKRIFCSMGSDSITQEFGTLSANNVVFKLVGPVLVKQDQAEAKSNVEKRLEFIGGEMCV